MYSFSALTLEESSRDTIPLSEFIVQDVTEDGGTDCSRRNVVYYNITHYKIILISIHWYNFTGKDKIFILQEGKLVGHVFPRTL